LREAMRILQNGGALGMFPEGTRSRTGQMQQARQGSAMVAVWSGAPVLPVGITGSDGILLWPNIIRRPRLVINVGPPFMLQAPGNGRSREALEDLNQEMMRRVAVLLPEAQRGLYADVQEHRD
jgi:1-acyl-sn-glycerol-3-phosphate acyltransferase